MYTALMVAGMKKTSFEVPKPPHLMPLVWSTSLLRPMLSLLGIYSFFRLAPHILLAIWIAIYGLEVLEHLFG